MAVAFRIQAWLGTNLFAHNKRVSEPLLVKQQSQMQECIWLLLIEEGNLNSKAQNLSLFDRPISI